MTVQSLLVAPQSSAPRTRRGEGPSAPVVDWSAFWRDFTWRQGEHVSMIGPTGSGKTTLGLRLLAKRNYAVALATKPRDDTMQQLVRAGYMLQRRWSPDVADRIVLWPKLEALSDTKKQEHVFRSCLNSTFRAGGWCIFLDEVSYLTDELRMDRMLRILWQQSRAGGVSLLAGTQRPAFVPLAMYDMATHLFFWRDTDERNRKRIGGLGGSDSRVIQREVGELLEHQTLYLNTRTGVRYRTTVQMEA